MQNLMLEFFLVTLYLVKFYKVFNKKTMVVEEFIHVVFNESNDSLEIKENVDDDEGLNFSIGRLQIEDEAHQ